tara:strand:+ start:351 stop:839 length:489 start_codon:yes stop_codon:yes gene_type:complete
MLAVRCFSKIYFANCSICKRESVRHLFEKEEINKIKNLLKWEQTNIFFKCSQCGNINNLCLDVSKRKQTEIFTWILLDKIFISYLKKRKKIEILKRKYRKNHKSNFEDKWIYQMLSDINISYFGHLKSDIKLLLQKHRYYNLYKSTDESIDQKADKIIKYYL